MSYFNLQNDRLNRLQNEQSPMIPLDTTNSFDQQANIAKPPPPSETLNTLLGGLSKGYSDLDSAGQSKVNELNQRVDAVRKGRTSLRPEEFERAMGEVHATAIDYPWEHHLKPPGSNPGDVIEQDGIRKVRNNEGGLDPISFTPQYMKDNIVPIGDSGQIAVPVSPKGGYKLVSARDRDLQGESNEIEKTTAAVGKIYDSLKKQMSPEKEVKDDKGKVLGVLPFTKSEENMLSAQAADIFLKQRLQAKNIMQTIADGGVSETRRATAGEAADPFKQEIQQQQLREEILLRGVAQRDAARELKHEEELVGRVALKDAAAELQQELYPTPSQSPLPGAPETDKPLTENEQALEEAFGSKTPTAEEKALAKATVNTQNAWGDQLVEAASTVKPLAAATKKEFTTTFKDHQDGVVVELPDGRRYIKDEGKFWQIPWSEKQVASPTMLDSAGEEIIDPSTGQPAAGIVKQLEAGKSATIGIAEDEPKLVKQNAVQRAAAKKAVIEKATVNKVAAEEAEARTLATGIKPIPSVAMKNFSSVSTPSQKKEVLEKSLKDPSVLRLFHNPQKIQDSSNITEFQAMPVGIPFVTDKGILVIRNVDGTFEKFEPSEYISGVKKATKDRMNRVRFAAPYHP